MSILVRCWDTAWTIGRLFGLMDKRGPHCRWSKFGWIRLLILCALYDNLRIPLQKFRFNGIIKCLMFLVALHALLSILYLDCKKRISNHILSLTFSIDSLSKICLRKSTVLGDMFSSFNMFWFKIMQIPFWWSAKDVKCPFDESKATCIGSLVKKFELKYEQLGLWTVFSSTVMSRGCCYFSLSLQKYSFNHHSLVYQESYVLQY